MRNRPRQRCAGDDVAHGGEDELGAERADVATQGDVHRLGRAVFGTRAMLRRTAPRRGREYAAEASAASGSARGDVEKRDSPRRHAAFQGERDTPGALLRRVVTDTQ
jgi:hypothetical protein